MFNGDVEEAVERYLNVNKEMYIVNEYGDARDRNDIDKAIKILKTTFTNKEESPIFYDNEKIEMDIEFVASRPFNDLAFRWTIHSSDDMRAGMATTAASIIANDGRNHVKILVPLDWMAPGKYFVDLTAYSVNQYGNNQLHDVINVAFSFEKIVNTNANNKMDWHSNWWGFLMFPEIKGMK